MTTTVLRFLGPLRGLVALALPPACVGCGREASALCVRCRVDLDWIALADAGPVRPDPCPPGFPPTWATARLSGPLRTALTAYKDRGRRDLTPFLAPLLARAVSASGVGADEPIVLVPVPGSARSRRMRGDCPLDALVLAAAAHLPGDVRVVRALRSVRAVADQAGLDVAHRRSNLHGSLQLVPGTESILGGARVILVDDIVTTGATLVEAGRALARAGVAPRAACIAATGRRAARQRYPSGS